MANNNNNSADSAVPTKDDVAKILEKRFGSYDISAQDWYREYLPIVEREVRFTLTSKDGLHSGTPIKIGSNDDIVRFMFENNMIKDTPAAAAAWARLNSSQGKNNFDTFSWDTGNDKPTAAAFNPDKYVRDQFDDVLDAAENDEIEKIVPVTYDQPAPKPKPKAKAKSAANVNVPQPVHLDIPRPAADFKSIKLDWLGEKPVDPQIVAQFTSEIGDFETYYHKVVYSEAVIYLVFDKRCKFGRFVPKMGGNLVTIIVEGHTYDGVLWAAAKFELGVMEITPFIISQNTEPDQSNYD